ncbi:MAG: dipicolinate synthase subunit B [Clostridia bacterium]|nr:dipicolinate synthase subunit B [Clostridia bacterium]
MKQVLGFAITGSFCTLETALGLVEKLREKYRVIPILSENAATTDTRFMKADSLRRRLTALCGTPPLTGLCEVEPLGPGKVLDLLMVCPCTGNTLSKLAHGITDTTVTMAVKSHRRNGGKVLLALSTNDALSGSAKSIGVLLDKKGYFFVPLRQDDAEGKPHSLQSLWDTVPDAVEAALEGKALSPLLR